MTILIIGEAVSHVPGAPIEGAIGKRLAEYAGITFDEFLASTERHNLLANPIEGPWPKQQARDAAQSIWPSMLGRRTILLGQNVARAFGIGEIPLRWRAIDDHGTEVAIVPHPSGLNLWWNDAPNRTAARRFLEMTFRAEP